MNNYTKFLANLANVDEVIQDENKALIMLSSLQDDEYETFILTVINGKKSLSYNEVSIAFVNHELRRKEESSSSTSAEALTARENGSNHWTDKRDLGKSKTGNHELKKKQHAFCKGRHWKVDCPKLKKNMSKSEANIAQADDAYDSNSSGYSLYYSYSLLFRYV